MCGIVGYITSDPKTHNSLRSDYMEQALYVDALRGQDSTGMFSVKMDQKAYYIKDAVDARLFLQQGSIKRAVSDQNRERWLCVGHNRKATLGSRDLSNAHPFIAGNICMVHNGTLTGYHQLPTHADGNSDSARVCAALAEAAPGGLELLPNLKGDYAFVWYDGRSKKLYLANNGRRPLSFLRYGDHTFFASEGMMAKFILSRTLELKQGEKLPQITHFKPFHLYEASLGQVKFKVTEYKEKVERTRTYPTNGRPASGVVDSRPTYGRNQGIRDIKTRMSGSTETRGKPGTMPTIPEKDVIEQLSYPNEPKKAAKKRITKINQLLKAVEVDLRVGDLIEIERDSAATYLKDAKAEDPKGKVEGFISWCLQDEDVLFYATVHNAPMYDVYSDFVDTVWGIVSGARFDERGDLHLSFEYVSLGRHRRPVPDNIDEKEWPKWIKETLDNQRHFYNKSDEPEYEWFESTCVLTTREMDIVLQDKTCCVCDAHSKVVPYDEMYFVCEDEFVCKECNESLVDKDEKPKGRSRTVAVTVHGEDGEHKRLMTVAEAEAIDAEYTEIPSGKKEVVEVPADEDDEDEYVDGPLDEEDKKKEKDNAVRDGKAILPAAVAQALQESCDSANLSQIQKAKEDARKVAEAQKLLDKMRQKKPRLRASNDGNIYDEDGKVVDINSARPPEAAKDQQRTTPTFTGKSSSGVTGNSGFAKPPGTYRHDTILTMKGKVPRK